MANTYTNIHIHFVFSVKFRRRSIHPKWQDELYKYITGIVRNNGHKMICINGMPDHLHLLVGMRPDQSISDLIKDVKANSSRWINDKRILKERFCWQSGFGAFATSKSQLSQVIRYINNQKEHHKKKTFREEYIAFLQKHELDYKEEYIFEDPI